MKIGRVLLGMSFALLGCCSIIGEVRHTGHFIVRLKDINGQPITNATVLVKTLNCSGLAAGVYESHYDCTRARTDTNGVADVCFQFLVGDFRWYVRTPSHYSQRFLSVSECFPARVVPSDYMYFSTNTVDGLAKFNELKALEDAGDYVGYAAKFEPKSVTYTTNVIYREVTGFYPKRNPQPMYAYESLHYPYLPTHSETVTSNGIDYVKYDDVEVDLKIGAFLPPWGGRNDYDAGEVSDFKIVSYSTKTNGVTEWFGWMEFAPGCGAYKRKKTGNDSFPSTYEADTNAVFLSRIPYRSYRRDGEEQRVAVEKLLSEDEYMVLRTRVLRNEDTGAITNCHYSKILGGMYCTRRVSFAASVFNHRPNDPNLEYQVTRKPIDGSRGCRWP